MKKIMIFARTLLFLSCMACLPTLYAASYTNAGENLGSSNFGIEMEVPAYSSLKFVKRNTAEQLSSSLSFNQFEALSGSTQGTQSLPQSNTTTKGASSLVVYCSSGKKLKLTVEKGDLIYQDTNNDINKIPYDVTIGDSQKENGFIELSSSRNIVTSSLDLSYSADKTINVLPITFKVSGIEWGSVPSGKYKDSISFTLEAY